MDWCNSGRSQSSTGGDEESVSSFLSPASSLAFTPLPHYRPPSSAASFDPLSGYLDALAWPPPPPPLPSVNLNPILNLDTWWDCSLCTSDHPNFIGTGSAQVAALPPYTLTPAPACNITTNSLQSPSFSSSHQPPPATHPPDPTSASSGGTSGGAQSRGSKKRPRPLRRAPTTVLTIDSSNFQAMVQDFTGGVPLLPLPLSSPAFPRSGRLDRFPAATSPAMSYLPLRPFARRAPLPPLFNSLSSSPTSSIANDITVAATCRTSANISVTRPIVANTSAAITAPNNSNKTATCNRYQPPSLPSDHSLDSQQVQHYNLLNLFIFQSLMQPSHEYGSLDVTNLGMDKSLQGVTSAVTATAADGSAIGGGSQSLMQPFHEYTSQDVAILAMEKTLGGVTSSVTVAAAEGYATGGGAMHGHASPVVSGGTSSLKGRNGDGDVQQWTGGSGSADQEGQFWPTAANNGNGAVG